jgi:hypothetical protein
LVHLHLGQYQKRKLAHGKHSPCFPPPTSATASTTP